MQVDVALLNVVSYWLTFKVIKPLSLCMLNSLHCWLFKLHYRQVCACCHHVFGTLQNGWGKAELLGPGRMTVTPDIMSPYPLILRVRGQLHLFGPGFQTCGTEVIIPHHL